MSPSYPPRKTTRWYYLSLLWQVQHHIAMLPEETVGRIMALLTPEEGLLFCTLFPDRLRGLIARFLDDTAVLPMAEEHSDFGYTPERLAAMKVIRTKIMSLGYEPPVASEEMEQRNERYTRELKDRLRTLGKPKKAEVQSEQCDDNEVIAEKMLATLLLLPNRTIREFVAPLSEDERLALTHWSNDAIKGVVFQFLTTQEVVDLEECPVGPKMSSALYAELAELNTRLMALNPKPATSAQKERLERRNARLAQKVERQRERRRRNKERASLLANYPNQPDLEQFTRRQVVEKIVHINCQCRIHTTRYDENYKSMPEFNPWLPKALVKERNPLFRWGLQVIQGKSDPNCLPPDTKVKVREQKIWMLTPFCECIENVGGVPFDEIAVLIDHKRGKDILKYALEVSALEVNRPSLDAYSRQELFDKLNMWCERFAERGWPELEEAQRLEQSRLLRTVLHVLCIGVPYQHWLPMIEQVYYSQLADKRDAIAYLMGKMANGETPNPHWVGSWGALCFQYRDTLHKRKNPLQNHWALDGCRKHRVSPARHIYIPGGIDTLYPLQIARKVHSFVCALRMHGTPFLVEVINREQSQFFKECWEILLPVWDRISDMWNEYKQHEGGETFSDRWDRVRAEHEEQYGVGQQLEMIGERWHAKLAENYQAALELFPFIGTERFDELLAKYDSPEPAVLPDRRCSLEEFTVTEVAARAAAYHQLCKRPLSPLYLELAPLDLNLPPWTPTELELVPFVRFMISYRADGLDPEDIHQTIAAALLIILRREREKIRMVTWGLDTYMLKGHGPGVLESVYRFCLEGQEQPS